MGHGWGQGKCEKKSQMRKERIFKKGKTELRTSMPTGKKARRSRIKSAQIQNTQGEDTHREKKVMP